MRNYISLLGILLIIAGIAIFAYRGYSYKTQEKIAEIGSVQITQQQTKSVHIPPVLGGVSVAVGLVLVFLGRRR